LIKPVDKKHKRFLRHKRIRKHLFGTAEKPRMVVTKSNKHISVQIIDDTEHRTIVSASTMEKDLKLEKTWDRDAAKIIGDLVAKRALEKSIKKVTFDRAGHKFHGKVKELADAARASGLEF
jgi:large subunit ribosomal protein L18